MKNIYKKLSVISVGSVILFVVNVQAKSQDDFIKTTPKVERNTQFESTPQIDVRPTVVVENIPKTITKNIPKKNVKKKITVVKKILTAVKKIVKKTPPVEAKKSVPVKSQPKVEEKPLYPLAEIPTLHDLLTKKVPKTSQEFKADHQIKWDRMNFTLDLLTNAYIRSNLNQAYARGSIHVKYHQEKQKLTQQTINVIDTVNLNDGVEFRTESAVGSGDSGIWSVVNHQIKLSGANATLQILTNNLTVIAQKYYTYDTISGLFKAVGNVRALSDGRTLRASTIYTKLTPIEMLKTGRVGGDKSDKSSDKSNTKKPTSLADRINNIQAIGNVKINTEEQQVTGSRATFYVKNDMVIVNGHAKIIRYPSKEELYAYKHRKDKTTGTKPTNRIIKADQIRGYLTKNNGGKSQQGIDKVIAVGHVTYTNENQTVIGSRALYHPKKNEALIYDVTAYRGEDSIKACMAHVDLVTTLTEIGPCEKNSINNSKSKKSITTFNRKFVKKGKKVDPSDQVVIELNVDSNNTKKLDKSLNKKLALPDFNVE